MSGTPPPGPPPPPPPPPTTALEKLKAKIDAIGGIVTVLGGIGTVALAGIATTSGAVRDVYEYASTFGKTGSQISAIDERMKVLESEKVSEKTATDKDRTEIARIADGLRLTIEKLTLAGADVGALREAIHQMELRLATLDGILQGMGERSVRTTNAPRGKKR